MLLLPARTVRQSFLLFMLTHLSEPFQISCFEPVGGEHCGAVFQARAQYVRAFMFDKNTQRLKTSQSASHSSVNKSAVLHRFALGTTQRCREYHPTGLSQRTPPSPILTHPDLWVPSRYLGFSKQKTPSGRAGATS